MCQKLDISTLISELQEANMLLIFVTLDVMIFSILGTLVNSLQ